MSQPPATPVKVPSAAASYTPATQDPDLRSQLNTLLLRDGHVQKIQEALLHKLNSHDSNWPSAIKSHAQSLLRSGEVTNYSDLLRRLLEDVRSDSAAAAEAAAAAAATSSSSSSSNKKSATNGKGASSDDSDKAAVNGTDKDKAGGDKLTEARALAVPQSVIDECLKITREALETVCEVDENGSA